MIFNPSAALRRYRERQRPAGSPHPPVRVLLASELRHLWRRITGRR